MANPYDNYEANVLNGHLAVQTGSTWQNLQDVYVKTGGSWQRAKEVYIRSGGSWRSIHEGDHFKFKVTLSTSNTNGFSLSGWLSGQGWNGSQSVKGVIQVNCYQGGSGIGLNVGTMPSDSRVFVRISANNRIQGQGGNGGTRGCGNGGNGSTALYTRTPIAVNNQGGIFGGGGGGGGGNNGTCSGTGTYYYGCMKGSTCSGQYTYYYGVNGGGGGGGAGYPAGSGVDGGGNGNADSGGGGAGGSGCGSAGGGNGGNPGEDGQTSSCSGGTRGAYIDGASYVYSWEANGDRRGQSVN
jgi:hypothetical protein